MSYIGARYESAESLRGFLNLTKVENDAAVNLAYADVTRTLTASTYENVSALRPENATLPYTLHLATRIYMPITHCLLDQFGAGLHTHYGADIAKVPFHTDKERARQEINQWVEESTQQTIRDLVRPLSLATFVSLVLASAIYFRASWEKKFWMTGKMKVGIFHPSPDESIHVLTLRARSVLRNGTIGDADCRLVEIPFADERFVLLLFMPNQVDKNALETMESKLTPQILGRLDDFLRKSKIKVILPKIEFNEQLSLGKIIQNDSIGVARLFARGKANFSGISGNNNLHLSHVEHKVRFELDELKRKVIKMPLSKENAQNSEKAKMQKMRTEFNRPFLFMVRDTYLNMFIIMGCVQKLASFNPD